MQGKTVTVHIPLFNEEANLAEVFRRVEMVAAQETRYRWDFLLIDNCSTDGSQALCEAKCAADRRYRYVRMSRNWQASAAVAAFDYCTADAMVVLFSDLQDPPELIPRMLRSWEEGNDLVSGVVRARRDSRLLKTLGAAVAYRLIDWLTDARMPRGATDFRLMDRKVVEAVRRCREFPRFTRGLVHWVGFRQVTFEYDRAPRVAGQSKGDLTHSLDVAFDAILNFSEKPLRMISLFGMMMLVIAMVAAVFYAWGNLTGRPAPRGVTTTFVLLLANLGFLSFFLGLVGEYLARAFVQVKNRPLYFVEKTVNVAGEAPQVRE
jgi:polyisoprenyl-phosphate glycosyltransferase